MSKRYVRGLRCSFCDKNQEVVGKLISSPRDYPRAYICDECISVCNSIIEDDRAAQEEVVAHEPQPMPSHPLLLHPLAPALMNAVARWVLEESMGRDASSTIAEMRTVMQQMLQSNP